MPLNLAPFMKHATNAAQMVSLSARRPASALSLLVSCLIVAHIQQKHFQFQRPLKVNLKFTIIYRNSLALALERPRLLPSAFSLHAKLR